MKKLRRYDNYLYWFYAYEKKMMDVFVRTASGGIVTIKKAIRQFLDIVATHIESLGHPPICLFETLFCGNVF